MQWKTDGQNNPQQGEKMSEGCDDSIDEDDSKRWLQRSQSLHKSLHRNPRAPLVSNIVFREASPPVMKFGIRFGSAPVHIVFLSEMLPCK